MEQAGLVVGVDPTGGDRAQVDRGRAHPADVADAGEELGHHAALFAAGASAS